MTLLERRLYKCWNYLSNIILVSDISLITPVQNITGRTDLSGKRDIYPSHSLNIFFIAYVFQLTVIRLYNSRIAQFKLYMCVC